jgi:outer membrane protein TolC
MFRVIIIALVLGVAGSLAAQPVMTLEEAIETGLKSNYDILVARNLAEISQRNRGLGTAGFLPTVDATARYSRADNHLETDPPPIDVDTDLDFLNAEIRLGWTIFDGFEMFTGRKRFDELARRGEFQTKNLIETSVLAIARSYLGLVSLEQLLQVARDTRAVSQSRYEREEVRNELGGASSTDLLNAQVSLNNDQATLLEQQLLVKVTREELNILLGRNPEEPLTVNPEITLTELGLTLDDILKLAREHNAALKTFEANKNVADLNVRSARVSFFPRLAAFASYGYTDQTLSAPDDASSSDLETKTTSSTIGLQLSWNLFNGRRDNIVLANARIESNNQSLALNEARHRLTATVRKAHETYSQRMELVTLNEQNVEAARRNLELQSESYRLGAATSLEFRDAQVKLSRAQTALITARFQARMAIIDLDRLMGRIVIE